jgi:hypothetical protein
MKLKPLLLGVALALVPIVAFASSHREAPFVAGHPTVDATDFYMFMNYGPNAPEGYVTLVANYHPFENPWGGPNYYEMNQNAAYDINIDNNGDAKPDMVFRFKFDNTFNNATVPAGPASAPKSETTAVPLVNIGPIMGMSGKNRNRAETYTVTVYPGTPGSTNGGVVKSSDGSSTFTVPEDNIGNKSIPHYNQYASQFIYKKVSVPGCKKPAMLFVGQRKDPFVVNLGEIFDLVNTNPAGSPYGAHNTLTYDSVTAIELSLPASCLTESSDQSIIGGWTTASLRQASVINPKPVGENSTEVVGGAYTQVSRLGAPLVNEVVIGLPDKDRFNGSQPQDDAQFLHYVTNPSLPVLLNVLFPDATTVPDTPRNDLVAAFLTGVKGLNQPSDLSAPGEELRLNTSVPPTQPDKQKTLGVLGGDLAGFPNGRRPYDDVVDIELRVAEGALCGYNDDMNCGSQTKPQNADVPFTDGARSPGPTASTEQVQGDEYMRDTYLDHFPYLEPPLPGAPNGKNGIPSN